MSFCPALKKPKPHAPQKATSQAQQAPQIPTQEAQKSHTASPRASQKPHEAESRSPRTPRKTRSPEPRSTPKKPQKAPEIPPKSKSFSKPAPRVNAQNRTKSQKKSKKPLQLCFHCDRIETGGEREQAPSKPPSPAKAYNSIFKRSAEATRQRHTAKGSVRPHHEQPQSQNTNTSHTASVSTYNLTRILRKVSRQPLGKHKQHPSE